MKKYKRAITYGTFDLFHVGHLELLKRIKGLADEVYVGVSTDEFNRKKGKTNIIPFNDRKTILESIIYVTKAFPESKWEQKVEDVLAFEADLFVMGDDWHGKFDFIKNYCEVIYLKRTQSVSSSEIKTQIRGLDTEAQQRIIELIATNLPRYNI